MAKIQLKSDIITPFGGLFSIFNLFDSCGLRRTIDSVLGQRSADIKAYSFGDIFLSLFASYLCGGDCLEDAAYLKPFWHERDGFRIASPDTIGRALRGLAEDNTCYTSDQGITYAFNTCDRMNHLLIKALVATKQLKRNDLIDLDFDHQFTPADKKGAKYSYKQADGYFPAVATVGGLIVGVENRDANDNVKFHQADTLERTFEQLEQIAKVRIRNFRADCGSYSKEIIAVIIAHCKHFYIRASNCQSREAEFMAHKDWQETCIGDKKCEVASFVFDGFLPNERLRLVVQRTTVVDEQTGAAKADLFGTRYIYRSILTNDWSSTERDIIIYYNQRGASERVFDCQNNDFGWAHLPFSFLNENAVFLVATAILKNFYLHILSSIGNRIKGIDLTSRLKRFIRLFVAVPAKWTRSGRQLVLNLYSRQPIYLQI